MALLYAGAITVLSTAAAPPLKGARPLLMSMESYYYLLAGALISGVICLLFNPLRRFTALFGFLLVFFAGYLQAEIIFRIIPPASFGFIKNTPPDPFWLHLQNFFLHRLYHIFPLLALFGFFSAIPAKLKLNLLKFGKWKTLTGTVNPKKPQQWNIIVGKVGILILSVLGIMILLKGKPAGFNPFMLIPVLLYAFWNCFVEEMLFRGFLLGVLAVPLGIETAVWVQAVLFALSHLDPSAPVFSLMAVPIFIFLGWLFGKASAETEGIGISWAMHGMIVTAIELKLLF